MKKKKYFQRKAGSTSTNNDVKKSEKLGSIDDVIFEYGEDDNGNRKQKVTVYLKNLEKIQLYLPEVLDKKSRDIQNAMTEGKSKTFTEPAKPTPDKDGNYDTFEVEKWKVLHAENKKEQDIYDENNNKAYSIMFQRCTDDLKMHLESVSEFEQIKKDRDGVLLSVLLLKVAKNETMEVCKTMHATQTLRATASFWQGGTAPLADFKKDFTSQVETLDATGFDIGWNEKLYEMYCSENSVDQTDADAVKKAKAALKEEILACMFIEGLDSKRYGQHKKQLHNDAVRGKGYPKTVESVLTFLRMYVPPTPIQNSRAGNGGERGSGLVMVNQGKEAKLKKLKAEQKAIFAKAKAAKTAAESAKDDDKGSTTKDKCFGCGENHRSFECPHLTQEERDKLKQLSQNIKSIHQGQVNANVKDDEGDDFDYNDREEEDGALMATIGGLLCAGAGTGNRSALDPNKLYLDTMASHHMINSAAHCQKGPYESDTVMKSNCNAGETTMNYKIKVGNIECWYYEDGIANILSVPQLERDGYSVAYQTGGCWNVVTPEGTVINFNSDDGGVTDRMPYVDLRQKIKGINCVNAKIPTVRDRREGYTKKQVEKATLARRLMATMGYPSERDFQNMREDGETQI